MNGVDANARPYRARQAETTSGGGPRLNWGGRGYRRLNPQRQAGIPSGSEIGQTPVADSCGLKSGLG